MKVDLDTIPRDKFNLIESSIGDTPVVLAFPKKTTYEWTKETLIFRSSVWDMDGNPVSLGFRKFFNWGESPHLAPIPFSTIANGGVKAYEKIDGSLLVVSKYRGEIIIRTRGTLDARNLSISGHEIDVIVEKYPQFFQTKHDENDSWNSSFLFEWVSPANKIIIGHDKPDIKLLAVVNHEDYSLWGQADVDVFARVYGLERPHRYEFNTIKEMISEISGWKDREGVCVYFKSDQEIRKIKGDWYLKLHRMKSEIGSPKRVFEVFRAFGYPNFDEFQQLMVDAYDWEIVNQVHPEMKMACQAHVAMLRNFEEWREIGKVVSRNHDNRGDIYRDLSSKYRDKFVLGGILHFMDDKVLGDIFLKKHFYQEIEKLGVNVEQGEIEEL